MWTRLGAVALVAGALPAVWWYVRATGSEGPALPVLEAAPDFTLCDQDGRRVGLADFPGRAKVLSFFYIRCSDARACPMTTRHFRRLQQALGEELGRRVVLLLITLDPEADSPGALKKYGQLYQADFRNWHFLTGTRTEIEAVCRDYQIVAEPQPDGSLRHSVITFLVDPENRIRRLYVANAWEPEELRCDLETLLGQNPGSSETEP